jgi:hypothetical protein
LFGRRKATIKPLSAFQRSEGGVKGHTGSTQNCEGCRKRRSGLNGEAINQQTYHSVRIKPRRMVIPKHSTKTNSTFGARSFCCTSMSSIGKNRKWLDRFHAQFTWVDAIVFVHFSLSIEKTKVQHHLSLIQSFPNTSSPLMHRWA